MAKFEDCASCAFHNVETEVCHDCEDADQWEEADLDDDDTDDVLRIVGSRPVFELKQVRQHDEEERIAA